jgi:hypothetical protein
MKSASYSLCCAPAATDPVLRKRSWQRLQRPLLLQRLPLQYPWRCPWPLAMLVTWFGRTPAVKSPGSCPQFRHRTQKLRCCTGCVCRLTRWLNVSSVQTSIEQAVAKTANVSSPYHHRPAAVPGARRAQRPRRRPGTFARVLQVHCAAGGWAVCHACCLPANTARSLRQYAVNPSSCELAVVDEHYICQPDVGSHTRVSCSTIPRVATQPRCLQVPCYGWLHGCRQCDRRRRGRRQRWRHGGPWCWAAGYHCRLPPKAEGRG